MKESKLLWAVLVAVVGSGVAVLMSGAVGPWQAASKSELAAVDRENKAEHAIFSTSIAGIHDDVRITKCYVMLPVRIVNGEDANTEKRNACILRGARWRPGGQD